MRTLYIYDATTRQYLDTIVQPESPLEPGIYFEVPNSTTKCPPPFEGKAVLTFVKNSWKITPDFRGEYWYDSVGDLVEITTLGYPEGVTKDLPDELMLKKAKLEKINQVRNWSFGRISAGISSDATGVTRGYPGGMADQININSATIIPSSLWCKNQFGNWEFYPHTIEQAKIVQKAMAENVQAIQTRYAEVIRVTEAATNLQMLELITW